jgi:hypothetical protein
VALGRQRVGKTVVLNAAVQYFRTQASAVKIWNADQQNRSHSLSRFFPDEAETVTGAGLRLGKEWIERQLEQLIEQRFDAVLDVGGGVTGFTQLLNEVPLLQGAEQAGIRVVGIFVTGPEPADLDFLASVNGTFLPPATVIVTNAGLVPDDFPADEAFLPVLGHSAVVSAVGRGARVATFPSLACMAKVVALGLPFPEAMNGKPGRNGEPPLGFFDRMRVHKWWSEDVPAFFREVPSDWLPQSVASTRIPEAEAAE